MGSNALFHAHGNRANIDDRKKRSFRFNLLLLPLAAIVLGRLRLLCDTVSLAFAFHWSSWYFKDLAGISVAVLRTLEKCAHKNVHTRCRKINSTLWNHLWNTCWVQRQIEIFCLFVLKYAVRWENAYLLRYLFHTSQLKSVQISVPSLKEKRCFYREWSHFIFFFFSWFTIWITPTREHIQLMTDFFNVCINSFLDAADITSFLNFKLLQTKTWMVNKDLT